MSLRLQVGLEAPQQGDAVAALSLQGPVAVQPLHELAFSGHGQITGDLAQPGENNVGPEHVTGIKGMCRA